MTQLDLTEWRPGGETYSPAFDYERLNRQQKLVWFLMCDEVWRTLAEIEHAIKQPQASISARLRDFRKLGLTVSRRRRGNPKDGVWEYSVRRPSA